MGHLVTVATCSLNQWALDWDGNLQRIIESIREAKRLGARLRVGPELEVPAYGCYDHFLESDIALHCWETIARILEHPDCRDIVLDVGSIVRHRNVQYNCRILILNGKILLIRPKLWLANDGNYREARWFTGWERPRHVEEYYLPRMIQKIQGSIKVPIGDAVISTPDTCFAAETCEELFTPDSPHINLGLNGVEIFTNSSGSHHNLRKLDQRLNLILDATSKVGGIYLYSNQQGCDGDRLYYDGASLVCINGELVSQGSQFSLRDVEVITAVCDLEAVRAKRLSFSRNQQAIKAPTYQRIEIDFPLSSDLFDLNVMPTPSRPVFYHKPEEELSLGPPAWLWDYLRRSKAAGFLLPLSGGIDSCSTAVMGFSMARMVYHAIQDGNKAVLDDCRRIAGAYEAKDWIPSSPQAIMKNLFHTVYMGMREQSSSETRKRAKDLAEGICSYHTEADIDEIYQAQKAVFIKATSFEAKFGVHGGSDVENLALQNIQSRSRMVLAYQFAALLPSARNRPGGGGLLVLGSGNVDEALRGYYTKGDNSFADLNPIGSVSKVDLRRFITFARDSFSLPVLQEFLDATPSAELVPISNGSVQSDEEEMGLTYNELGILGRLRKEKKLGTVGIFQELLHLWKDDYTAREIAVKVKRFHHFYRINRHKMTTLTPAYHAEAYSPDDNRFDLRPFNYPSLWGGREFQQIDEMVDKIEKENLQKDDR